MKRSRFSEEQIIAVLKEQEAGMPTAEVCRRHGISSATFYKWKSKFGGLEVSDARRLRTLEQENSRLKKLLAEAMLDNVVLKDLASKMYDPPCPCKGRLVLTVPVCTNVSGLSRVGRCCGQALMRSARLVPR
ncbi:transposase [Aurantiacibacter atlanticus]|uniref:Transposase n=1 Tax=Aurantiacibacter atlanticus TaxID=1648404 RepID=A0A161I9V1_9SPHN|nr:transposase [Aurantiacibacter atlanticus]